MYTCSTKTFDGPKLSPLTDLEVLYKQKVKAKLELSAAWLSVECPNMHKESLHKDQNLVILSFKESVQSLANHELTKWRLQWTHKTKTQTLQSSLEMSQTTTNPGRT